MNYDDDELAEAALLLAHVEPRTMPEPLAQKIANQARAVGAEARFSTTKAASVALEVDELPKRARAGGLRVWSGWSGWLAAAACFAFAVYGWRSRSMQALEGGRGLAVEGRSRSLGIQDAAGRHLAVVRWDATTGSGEVAIAALPANAPEERYELWLSPDAESQALPVGAFVCAAECRDRLFDFPLPSSLAAAKRVWLTRGSAPKVPSLHAKERIVGEGSAKTE